MKKYRVNLHLVTDYTFIVEAESAEDAQAMVEDNPELKADFVAETDSINVSERNNPEEYGW